MELASTRDHELLLTHQLCRPDPQLKGQRIERLYDELSRLTTVTTKRDDGTTEDVITFTYDANGNRLSATDNDSALDFTYDKLNRLKTAATRDATAYPGAVQPAVVLINLYDAVGNRTALTHGPNELTVDGTWTYAYDGAGRLAELVNPGGDPLNPVVLGYDPAGRLSRIDFPNQVVSEATYDLDGRLQNITHTKGLIDLASFSYQFFDDGLIQSVTEPAGTRNFTYDGFQQLLSGGFATAPESYTYDEEGNRLTSHLSTSHEYDDANQLTGDDAFCYDYDSNGNLDTKTENIDGLCVGNPKTVYNWDIRNRLVRIDFRVDLPDATYAAYRYDALGRRIERDVNGTVTRYVYDGDNIVLEYDSANVPIARYSHGDRIDQPLVLERGVQSYFYHVSRLGSVRTLTDINGSVVNSYRYEDFGRFEFRTESVSNPYTFTAREFDPESGLYYYRARYYDSFTGRFISQDPLYFSAGDLNLYRYVFNSPNKYVDPDGKTELISRGLVTASIFGIAAALQFALAEPDVKADLVRRIASFGVTLNAVISCVANKVASAFYSVGITSPTAGDTIVCSVDDDAQAPGMPTEEDGYTPPKNWDGKKRKNPNGPGSGWPDKNGDVWVPTGPGPRAHGGPHWDVQSEGGGHRNVYPGGFVR